MCVVLLSSLAPQVSFATRQIASICDSAAIVASREIGVPLDVLRAIALTETGRKKGGEFLPWPWTVNMEGAGKWFDDMQSAQTYVDNHFDRGARSFDVGCFQINYRWHGQAFSSIEEMFDPISNARYAARFLRDLHGEFGDWSAAAGAYHSRTPKFANKYKARFDRIRANLKKTEDNPQVNLVAHPVTQNAPERTPAYLRTNNFPLLQPGANPSPSSLVPIGNSSYGSLIDFATPRPMLTGR
jgi:hypothetical protein